LRRRTTRCLPRRPNAPTLSAGVLLKIIRIIIHLKKKKTSTSGNNNINTTTTPRRHTHTHISNNPKTKID
jgi:hypothetical protein